MPLVLSLKRGQDFFVNNERIVVSNVFSETQFQLKRAADGRVFDVIDSAVVEILPDVYVQAGDRPQSALARVSIDAPPDKLILRGDKYRAQRGINEQV